MIIRYENFKIDFDEAKSLSVDKGKLIFETVGGDKVLTFKDQSADVGDQISEYIVQCYKKGYKRLNLGDFLGDPYAVSSEWG